MKKRKAKKVEIPVMIRAEKKRAHPLEKGLAHIDDLVAIFPDQVGTDDPRTMTCYQRVGEHGSCSSSYAGARTRPAKPGEVRKMLALLRRVGYGKGTSDSPALRVVARPSAHHARARREQVK